MTYRELINKVHLYSGFSKTESKDALDGTVAAIAVHLTEGERRKFASQLPQELQALALAVFATRENSREDLLDQFITMQQIAGDRAKKQLLTAWRVLSEAMSNGLISHVQAQLPNRAVALLRLTA